MSATRRGSVRSDLDAYFTPIDVARAITRRLLADGLVKKGGRYLEPSAGKGSFVIAAEEILQPEDLDVVDLRLHQELQSLDISNEYEMDFLDFKPSRPYTIIQGNPPFSEAEQHVRHAITMLAPDGRLAFLLRVNFLEGKERQLGFWKEFPPEYVYVLNRRPSFTTKLRPKINRQTGLPILSKKTGEPLMVKTANDSIAYGVFVWSKQQSEFEPVIRFLQWKGKGNGNG